MDLEKIIFFNLILYDAESYLIAADYAEEHGFLVPNAIRNKILPLEIDQCFRYSYGNCNGFGDGEGSGIGCGDGDGDGFGNGCWDTDVYYDDGSGFGDGSGESYGIAEGWGDRGY